MADKLTHEEFDRRVREAMKPAQTMGGSFSPAIQQLRQTAKLRKPLENRPLQPAS